MVGIYKITSPTGKVYIGQSTDIEKRWKHYKKHKCKSQRRLYNSFQKYGVDNHKFEILYVIEDYIPELYWSHLNDLEVWYWLKSKMTGHKLLNIRFPGSNGNLSEETKKRIGESNKGKTRSPEAKKKISESKKGKKRSPLSEETKKKLSKGRLGNKYGRGNKGKTRSPEAKKKMSDAWKCRNPISEETRKKISAAHTGKVLSEETKEKLRVRHTGKILSEECKIKLSKAHKGKKHSEEHKNKLSEAFKGEKSSTAKLAKQQVVEIWELLKRNHKLTEISKIYNISSSSISDIKAGRTWNDVTGLSKN